MENKKGKGIKKAVLLIVVILLLAILSVTGYYAYMGYEMYTKALEEKNIS